MLNLFEITVRFQPALNEYIDLCTSVEELVRDKTYNIFDKRLLIWDEVQHLVCQVKNVLQSQLFLARAKSMTWNRRN